mgnify:CR=1 FL=1
MKSVFFTVLIALPVFAMAETPAELWKSGYKIVWESVYEDVEECTPDDPITLSSEYIFICDGYEYVYHYGSVYVAAKEFTYNGRKFFSTYLCLEDDEECLSGNMYRR